VPQQFTEDTAGDDKNRAEREGNDDENQDRKIFREHARLSLGDAKGPRGGRTIRRILQAARKEVNLNTILIRHELTERK
jgi:hypothetical protein